MRKFTMAFIAIGLMALSANACPTGAMVARVRNAVFAPRTVATKTVSTTRTVSYGTAAAVRRFWSYSFPRPMPTMKAVVAVKKCPNCP